MWTSLDDEPRTVWTDVCVCLCVSAFLNTFSFVSVCVYYCSTYYKAVRESSEGKWRTCATKDYEPRPM